MHSIEGLTKQKFLSEGRRFSFFRHTVWTILIFSYYFQFPLTEMSHLIAPCFALYFLLSSRGLLRGVDRRFFLVWVGFALFLTVNLFISISFFSAQDIAWRVYFILLVIPLCFFLRTRQFVIEYQIFKYLSILKAVFLLLAAFFMVYVGDFVPFRIWAQSLGGDMYFVYGGIPRIQIAGNPLLLLALLFEYTRTRKISISIFLFFLGVLIQGNFSFYLVLMLFVFYSTFRGVHSKKTTYTKYIAIIFCVFLSVAFLFYSFDQKEQKEDGANAIRLLQAEILTSGDPLLGNGMGVKVFDNVRIGREPTDKYFELQTLYVYYQIGLIGLLLFYTMNVMALKLYNSSDVNYIYLSYLVASFFNPYCFDVTQMITVVICANFVYLLRDQERY